MKKIVSFVSALLAFGAAFVSCHRAGTPRSAAQEKKINLKDFDSSRWIASFEAGKLFSAKTGKKIILFFSDDRDGPDKGLADGFIVRDDFVKKLSDEFVLVNVDFSEERFIEMEQAEETAYSAEGVSDDEREAALGRMNALLDDVKLTRMYNVAQTPSLYVVSDRGLVIDVLPVTPGTDEDAFLALVDGARGKIAEFDGDLERIKKARGVEKARAIDEFFEKTPLDYRYFLSDLCMELVDADKKDETALVGKHLLVVANNRAVDRFLDQNPEGASDEFIAVAENKRLSGDERQQAYYTAGYLLAQSGSVQYGKIKDCFQKAYDAAPESEYAEKIKEMVQLAAEREAEFEQMLNGQSQDAPFGPHPADVPEPAAPDGAQGGA